jgi:microsomal dipeptidase-like Zn-dependent dipeptidase
MRNSNALRREQGEGALSWRRYPVVAVAALFALWPSTVFAVSAGEEDPAGTVAGVDRNVMAAEAYSDLPWFYVKGFESIAELPNVTQGLMQRGWSTADIRKVLGENWLRVYKQVWGA